MGLHLHSKRYYSSTAQLIGLSEALSPHNQALDYNGNYLISHNSIVNWATLYLNSGKYLFNHYYHWLHKQSYSTKHYAGLDDKITCNPDLTYEIDDTLVDKVLTNLGVNKDDLKEYTIDIRNANTNEIDYVKCTITDYNFDDDTITENGVVYNYDDYWFDDLSTIRVYFTAEDGTKLEKTIPAYKMHSTDEVVGYDYLYCEVIYKETLHTQAWMFELPVNGTTTVYQYDGYDFTKKNDTTMNILPLIPIKKGGYWHNFWDWNDYQLIAWRYKKDEGLTGAYNDASSEMQKKYTDAYNNLYKKCKYKNKIDTYKTYKKAAKRMGGDIRQQMSALYNMLCGFMSGVTDRGNIRNQCYDVYYGWMCPLHAIRSDACITHTGDFLSTYKNLQAKYPNRPEIAQYAYYTYHSSDTIFT